MLISEHISYNLQIDTNKFKLENKKEAIFWQRLKPSLKPWHEYLVQIGMLCLVERLFHN
jgi:hypothetical protein